VWFLEPPPKTTIIISPHHKGARYSGKFAENIVGKFAMRLTVVYFLSAMLSWLHVFGQEIPVATGNDSVRITAGERYLIQRDSIARVRAREKFLADSTANAFLLPDPNRQNKLADSILKSRNKYLEGDAFLKMPAKKKSILKLGHTRQTRDPWVIVILGGLLVYTALLHRVLNKDFNNVLQSFYSKRVLGQVSKEDTLINSWAFIGFFLLFAFTFGLFLYQFSAYRSNYYSFSGLNLFIELSLIILAIFAVKFVVLKFIGFVFNSNKIVSNYLSVLYLTYFNIAFVFLPVCVCFSLIDTPLIPVVLYTGLALIIVIFIWQYLRSSVNLVSNIRFHIFYLFIYLCALEICPVLILIKALDI
jgi:hypothetical protein